MSLTKECTETDIAPKRIRFLSPYWAKCFTALLLFTATPVALGLVQGTEAEPQEGSPAEGALEKIEEASRFLENITRSWKGFRFAPGDFPAGAGFVYGVGYTPLGPDAFASDAELPNRADVDLVASYSTRKYFQVGFDLTLHDLGGVPLNLAFQVKANELPQEDFFGFGPTSREQDRTNYLMRSLEVGAEIQFRPFKRWSVGGGMTHLSPRIGSGRDDRFLSTEELFDETTLPGFQAQPDFWRYHGSLRYDYRDQPSNPRVGGFYGGRLSSFRDRDLDTYHFRHFEGDLQQYLPLPKSSVIALRLNLVMTDFSTGNAVPFYYMPTLGGGEKLRGFREFRFRDLNSLLLTAEYRWQAWPSFNMTLFVDAGKVTFDHADLNFRDLETSYGIGFRFYSPEALLLRLDLAFSREGFIPLFRYIHVF